jgi:hypothetical protein
LCRLALDRFSLEAITDHVLEVEVLPPFWSALRDTAADEVLAAEPKQRTKEPEPASSVAEHRAENALVWSFSLARPEFPCPAMRTPPPGEIAKLQLFVKWCGTSGNLYVWLAPEDVQFRASLIWAPASGDEVAVDRPDERGDYCIAGLGGRPEFGDVLRGSLSVRLSSRTTPTARWYKCEFNLAIGEIPPGDNPRCESED